jgi:DNA-binding transcriptional LysR family regulator
MEIPDTRQLKVFVMLAETRSFTAAAKRLYVTQSAISHSIKSLETALDCRLFDRNGKNIALTPHGETFLERAIKILYELETGMEELSTLSRWGHGKLRIGATHTVCQYLLPGVLREFRESFPDCDIAVSAGDSSVLQEMVTRGDIDLAFGLDTDALEPSLNFRPLFEDQLAFVVSPTHPWAKMKTIPVEDYANAKFIVFTRKSYTFRMIELFLRGKGVRMGSLLELGNMEAIKEMAKIGLGVGIVAPWMALKDTDENSLVLVRLEKEALKRQWGLFYVRTKELSLIEETFAGICETVSRDFANKERSRMVVSPAVA